MERNVQVGEEHRFPDCPPDGFQSQTEHRGFQGTLSRNEKIDIGRVRTLEVLLSVYDGILSPVMLRAFFVETLDR